MTSVQSIGSFSFGSKKSFVKKTPNMNNAQTVNFGCMHKKVLVTGIAPSKILAANFFHDDSAAKYLNTIISGATVTTVNKLGRVVKRVRKNISVDYQYNDSGKLIKKIFKDNNNPEKMISVDMDIKAGKKIRITTFINNKKENSILMSPKTGVKYAEMSYYPDGKTAKTIIEYNLDTGKPAKTTTLLPNGNILSVK